MKIRNLVIIFTIGLMAASCTDKAAQEENEKLRADMMAADSICTADKQMLLDSIHAIQMRLDSIMMPLNTTGGKSTSSTKTTTTTTTDKGGVDVNKKEGANQTIDVNKKTGTNEKVDVNKKTDATKTGDDK
ncbi:MAG TPA: hypothetical protein VFM99_07120 [Chitinophagales bacterium]|nr:hypothetical protein [Chitinophagales bacterium]